jgi:hypothetical protein
VHLKVLLVHLQEVAIFDPYQMKTHESIKGKIGVSDYVNSNTPSREMFIRIDPGVASPRMCEFYDDRIFSAFFATRIGVTLCQTVRAGLPRWYGGDLTGQRDGEK